jgi:hypothetical protein
MALEITGNSAKIWRDFMCFFYGKVIYNLEMFRFKKSEFPASKAPYLMIGGCQIARFD